MLVNNVLGRFAITFTGKHGANRHFSIVKTTIEGANVHWKLRETVRARAAGKPTCDQCAMTAKTFAPAVRTFLRELAAALRKLGRATAIVQRTDQAQAQTPRGAYPGGDPRLFHERQTPSAKGLRLGDNFIEIPDNSRQNFRQRAVYRSTAPNQPTLMSGPIYALQMHFSYTFRHPV